MHLMWSPIIVQVGSSVLHELQSADTGVKVIAIIKSGSEKSMDDLL